MSFKQFHIIRAQSKKIAEKDVEIKRLKRMFYDFADHPFYTYAEFEKDFDERAATEGVERDE